MKHIKSAIEFYREAVSKEFIDGLIVGAGLTTRESVYSAAVVVWLMIFQRLNADSTLSAAVDDLREGVSLELFNGAEESLKIRAQRISEATGGYAQARNRIPVTVVAGAADRMNEAMGAAEAGTYILDGSVLTAALSRKNLAEYGQQNSGGKIAHFPLVRIGVAVNATTGFALRPVFGAFSGEAAKSELALAPELLTRIPAASTVIADRYYGCFRFIAEACKQSLTPIVRLRDLVWRRHMRTIPKGSGEQEILWTPSAYERRRYPDLFTSEGVKGRLIWYRIQRKGFRGTTLLLFTTSRLPLNEIIELYGLRWNVETDLRNLKSTLRLSFISAKSPEMLQKEVILAFVAYNLVRKFMGSASRYLKTPVREMSFMSALRRFRAFGGLLILEKLTDAQVEHRVRDFINGFSSLRLPSRRKQQKLPPRRKWGRGASTTNYRQ